MTEPILKDQQNVWTFKDYAQIADWIGTFPKGATIREIEQHFNGCGEMRHRLRFMTREGIIKLIALDVGDDRKHAQIQHSYIQLRRIEPKDKPLPRGQGSSMLSRFSTPVQRPSEMPNEERITPMPIVKVVDEQPIRPAPAAAPQEVTVTYSTSTKTLAIYSNDLSVVIGNVNLKLELS